MHSRKHFFLICGLILSIGISSEALATGNNGTELLYTQDSDEDLFQTGMALYRESEFDSAASIFSSLDTPEARLFAGKSYFAISDYPLAQNYLQKVTREDDPRIFDEARYTLALTDFQTGQFGRSLDFLHDLKSRPSNQNLHRDAGQLYDQIMGYLTTGQRRQAFMQSASTAVRLDLFRYGLDHMVQSEAAEVYHALHNYFEATIDTNLLGALERRMERLPVNRPMDNYFGKAPAGITYNIGILLPETEEGSPEWEISRSLYNGYLLAAEEFNRTHENKNIRLHHLVTSDTTLTQEAAMSRLAWKNHAHAVIGPLFSDNAYRIRDLAEYYKIPVIAPLANADTLNIDHPYIYQINPTFETRGKAMARFAVNELKLDSLAVITQKGQPITREARSFRNEAERLGATVVHYFSDDFEARAFEVGHITPWFAGDREYYNEDGEENERDEEEIKIPLKPVKGLYISVSGQGAEQLIELILNDLQAFRSNVTILGNEEMAHVELSDSRKSYFDIYYSNFFHVNSDRRETYDFTTNYRALTGSTPDNFAHLGYDVAKFLFDSIHTLENPARIKSHLRHKPRYEGVISQIDFRNTHVNQYLHYLHIKRDETVVYTPENNEED